MASDACVRLARRLFKGRSAPAAAITIEDAGDGIEPAMDVPSADAGRGMEGTELPTKLLLVDYENVQQVDFGLVAEGYDVMVFVGANQKSVPIELVAGAQKLGSRVRWERVDGSGRNALDFFIACQLGRVAERSSGTQCTVLSKDKGFDPLLRHLNRNGLKCRRINSLLELGAKAQPKSEPNYMRVVEVLGRSEKKSRPRTRLTLKKHVAAMFNGNPLKPAELNRVIDLLFANKMISETNNRLTYEF